MTVRNEGKEQRSPRTSGGKLANLQQRFEESDVGKVVISAFVAVFVLIGVLWNVPDSPIRRSLMPVVTWSRREQDSTSTGGCTGRRTPGSRRSKFTSRWPTARTGVDHAAWRAWHRLVGSLDTDEACRDPRRASDHSSPDGSSARSPGPIERVVGVTVVYRTRLYRRLVRVFRKTGHEGPVPRGVGRSARTESDSSRRSLVGTITDRWCAFWFTPSRLHAGSRPNDVRRRCSRVDPRTAA